jgi:putative methionine-R-sulfoxide reductase with GAF domain
MRHYFETVTWQPIIENVTDILRITVCIIDSRGQPVLIPNQSRYGWAFLPQFLEIQSKWVQTTKDCFEFTDNFYIRHYAIPFRPVNQEISGYVILGPMILNKRLIIDEYNEISRKYDTNFDKFREKLEEIRVVSQVNLEQILDTIISFSKINQESLNLQELNPLEDNRIQKIFKSMLDLSLSVANAESGSVMLFNSQTNELQVRAAKGLNDHYLNNTVKLDEGISGIAFKENKTLVIKDGQKNSLICDLLKRAEIRESIVMPFGAPDQKNRGVLNLNIMKPGIDINRVDRINEALKRITTNILEAI